MESAETKIRPGMELLATTKHRIVALCEFKGQIILATESGVYRLRNDKFIPIPFADEESNV
jgi:hypothetical protein